MGRDCTKEERKQYAVEIGSDGLLPLQHNHAAVHTLGPDATNQPRLSGRERC